MNQQRALHICRHCRYYGVAAESYCPLCGNQLISECPDCGQEIANPYAKFCTHCGHSLTEKEIMDSG